MNRRHHALALARRFRTCPTPDSTGLPETHPQMVAHRQRCPLCVELGIDDPWQTIARRILSLAAAKEKAGPRQLTPGDLVPVKAERARWLGDLFYHPPLVVVLAECPSIPEAVQVAQVYHDTLLAGPGDLIIEDPESPLGPFFIECWNRYTLRRQDLGDLLLKLSGDRVEAAIAMGQDASALPVWAPLPISMTGENDPRLAFRRMEIEVGFVFAQASVDALMNGIDEDRFALAPLPALHAALERLIPGIRWRSQSADPEEAFAVAELPDDFYPLAAAGDQVTLWGRRIDLVDDRPERIFPFTPSLDHAAALGGGFTGIGGHVDRAPGSVRQSRLLAAWIQPGQPPVVCQTVDWDPVSGIFYIEIPVADLRRVRIEVTLLVEASDA